MQFLVCKAFFIVKKWPLGQAVKTPPFHGGNRGSIPLGVTKWKFSSAGRASALQAEGHRFDPYNFHQVFFRGPVVQSVRTLACHARGRRFESVLDRHLQFYKVKLPDVVWSKSAISARLCILGNEVSRRVKAQSAGVAQLVEQLTCNQ